MNRFGEEAEVILENIRPRFLAHRNGELYWLTDRDSGLIMVFADLEAVRELYRQIGDVMCWSKAMEETR